MSNTSIVPHRANRPRPKYRSFRSFYITVLILSLFAVVSLVADQAARYRQGTQYGLAQKRALEQLDPGRLVKRDIEVTHSQKILRFWALLTLSFYSVA